MLLALPDFTPSQAAQHHRTLIVNGKPAQVSVVEINGRSYVDLEALARVANGSLGFKGNQITLTLPNATSTPADAASSATLPADPGLSKGFLKAGIEAMSVVREWHSALANAIQNGFPLAESWLSGYRTQTATALRLAGVAGSTDSDRNAFQLLTNEFNNMSRLSDRYLAARQSLTFISPDALQNDPLNQKILNCGRSLAAMAASRQFEDDGSCQ
jgi:hypothetical protein